jgi:hypothetical protein
MGVEHLPSKHKVLGSKPMAEKNKKKERKRRKEKRKTPNTSRTFYLLRVELT